MLDFMIVCVRARWIALGQILRLTRVVCYSDGFLL